MATRTARLATLAVAALTVCLSVAGCSSSGSSQPAATSGSAGSSAAGAPPTGSAGVSTSAAPVSITIKNFAYTVSGPAPGGSTVKVTNNDSQAHTVTADSGKAFDVTLQPGKSATFTAPKQAGRYKFHCTFHSNMHGTLMVTK